MDLAGWKSQLRKGAAELAVLGLLADGERYGLELLEKLEGADYIGVSEGTIYPLLNRLERDGKVSSRWREVADASHPRKYYTLTADGRKTLASMRDEWKHFAGALNRILNRANI